VAVRSRLSRPGLTGALVAGVVGGALLMSSLARVPQGSLGVAGGRLRASGWHLKSPFDRLRIFPLAGRLEAVDIERLTDEGAAIRIRLSLAYELDSGALGGRATDLDRRGLRPLVALLAREALDALPLAALLPPDLPLQGGARAPLPGPAIEAVGAALRASGIGPIDLTARIGPPDAFSPADATVPGDRLAGATPAGAGPRPAGNEGPRAEETGIRLLLIGLDGADWDIIDPLLKSGRLPNLARLTASGARGPLRSYDPMISPLLWTTMATGLGPDLHGVADFQAIDPATGRRVPIGSRFRKVKALWNMLSDAGKTSGFVAWWASFPAETVKGYQVSNLVVYETLRPKPEHATTPAGMTFPPEYFRTIRPALRSAADLTYDEVTSLLHIGRPEFEAARRDVLSPPTGDEETERRKRTQEPVPLAISILTGSTNYATIAADLAARRLDLTAVYFEGIDMMGHRFQHCMPPRMAICPPEDFDRFRDAVTSFYIRQDELIGRVLGAAGPGATVMVVSDHGFKSGAGRPGVLPFTTRQPVEWHDEDGILVLSGPGARRGVRLAERATLFDIAPTVLHLLGLPISEEMPGRVLLGALDPDFTRSHPVRMIRSYETIGAPRETVAPGGAGAEEAEAELLDNLRALGYIGGDAADASPAPPTAGAQTGPPSPPGQPGAETQVFYHRNLATYFLKRKEYAKAAAQLRLANDRQKLPKNYQMLSEAYLGLGKRDEAIAILEEGLQSIDRMDPESVLWIVQLHLAAGRRVEAAEQARRWATRTATMPGLDDAVAGLLKEDEGDRAGAVTCYERSLAADPARVVAAQRLYALLAPERRAQVLEPALRRGLARDPRIDEYHNLLGVILAERGRPAEALDSFRRAEELDPDNPRFAANLGGALAKLGRWEEAATVYERTAAMSPSAAICMKLGSVYRRLGRPEKALSAFERARVLGDRGSAPILGIALAKAEMDNIAEALTAVREGLDLHPGDGALRSLYDDLLRRKRTSDAAPDRSGPG
jgi:tetratricopeptide (TPR) repeat protein